MSLSEMKEKAEAETTKVARMESFIFDFLTERAICGRPQATHEIKPTSKSLAYVCGTVELVYTTEFWV